LDAVDHKRILKVWKSKAAPLQHSSMSSPTIPMLWLSCLTLQSVSIRMTMTCQFALLFVTKPSSATEPAATLMNINVARKHFEKLAEP
jgi:hypothetical protein